MNNRNQARMSRGLIWACALVFAVFLTWANWAELDQVTRAGGHVIASSRNQVIQVMEGGILTELPVREGSPVKRGQLLARFDQTKAKAGYLEAKAKTAALQATIARLQAEIFGGAPEFPPSLNPYPEFRANQLALFKKRQGALQEELTALRQGEELIKEELEMNLPLLKTGDVSKAEIIKLQRQLVDIRGVITNKQNKYLQDCQAEMVKAEEDLTGVQQILAQRKEQLSFTEVLSPMDGVVRNIRITTLGGVAKPGEEIMQIVPIDDDRIIEAKMRPADVAFVKPGLPAMIKLDAYDYSIYGALHGEVIYISPDTLIEETRGTEQPYYRVQVKISGQGLNNPGQGNIEIQPGMTATVEIVTGKRTVFYYLTKPITKTLSESMGER